MIYMEWLLKYHQWRSTVRTYWHEHFRYHVAEKNTQLGKVNLYTDLRHFKHAYCLS